MVDFTNKNNVLKSVQPEGMEAAISRKVKNIEYFIEMYR